MIKIKDNILSLSLLLTIPLFHVFYVILNNSSRGVHSVATELDRTIPFIEEFIIPYVLWYAFIFIIFGYLCLKERPLYYKTLIAYLMGVGICYIIYYFFQTVVPRPTVVSDDWITSLVVYIYKSDAPYNGFPSIHVLTTYIMMKAINKCQINRWITICIYALGVLIIASTLFVKQHVLYDVISATLLGAIIFRWVYHFDLEKATTVWRRREELEDEYPVRSYRA
jgi:membrane-associated phospholipid phosphatase